MNRYLSLSITEKYDTVLYCKQQGVFLLYLSTPKIQFLFISGFTTDWGVKGGSMGCREAKKGQEVQRGQGGSRDIIGGHGGLKEVS